jgi:L-alanine-DL-glutamate epimerase-like enolase superfamily enzyme
MRLESIRSEVLAIPFKVAFKHASADRKAMQSLWVEVRSASGTAGMGEGCPREYVTGESLATARDFVERHRGDWLGAIVDVSSLAAWVGKNRGAIDANPAAWSAVELALLDCLGKEDGLTLERLLGTPPLTGIYRYSAVIGDAPAAAFEAQLATYLKGGLRDFKIKLAGEVERDLGKVRALSAAGIAPQSVRADANNLWSDAYAAVAHLSSLEFPFFAIEEPLKPGDCDGMRHIARSLGARIILDESALREEQLPALREDAQRWIVNLRVSKMGGMIRSVQVARKAQELGLAIVVGAHVGETSVLTRAGLTIAELARDVLVAQEGAFGTHLLERDAVTPSLVFGAGGVLDLAAYPPLGPGLGLKKVESDPNQSIAMK